MNNFMKPRYILLLLVAAIQLFSAHSQIEWNEFCGVYVQTVTVKNDERRITEIYHGATQAELSGMLWNTFLKGPLWTISLSAATKYSLDASRAHTQMSKSFLITEQQKDFHTVVGGGLACLGLALGLKTLCSGWNIITDGYNLWSKRVKNNTLPSDITAKFNNPQDLTFFKNTQRSC